jgi:uncharacterized protein DUF4158
LGFVPDDLTAAPAEAIAVLGVVLDAPPRAVFDYSVRPQTRREHRPLVREHAGFRAGGRAELETLAGWLTERALEHDRPSLLLGELVAELRRRRIDRPAVDRLMRLVASARERAHEQTFQRLASQLTSAVREVLARAGSGDRRAHAARVAAVAPDDGEREGDAPRARQARAFLLVETVSADRFDLSELPPNRRAWLAQTGRQQTNQALARMASERRYPVLMAFCVEALERATDDALGCSTGRSAPPTAAQARGARAPRPPRHPGHGAAVHRSLWRGAGGPRLRHRRAAADRAANRDRAAARRPRPRPGHRAAGRHWALDLLIGEHGSAGRKLLAEVIGSLELRAAGVGEDELIAGLRLIRQLAGEGDKRRWLPGFSRARSSTTSGARTSSTPPAAAWIAAPTSYVGVNDPSGFSQEHQTTINAA